MLTIAALAILAAATFMAVAYAIAWALARGITAYQQRNDQETARAEREAMGNARRAAKWNVC